MEERRSVNVAEVDFSHRYKGTREFSSQAVRFTLTGSYCDYPEGTPEYRRFWDNETKRCMEGVRLPSGESITGYHYFYLNYCPIYVVKQKESGRRVREVGFADFWDYDAFFFEYIDECEKAGRHAAVLKARKRGYSYKAASMLVRNYEMIPGSKNYAVASEQKFLLGDGILTKAWYIMDFVDRHTAWKKARLVNTRMERTSGYKIIDDDGKETLNGYQSSIVGITLHGDPERVRGSRGRLCVWEEAGKFPDLGQAWTIERSSLETDDGVAFGLSLAFGTGGTEGADFLTLSDMFYHPLSYNILPVTNIWEETFEKARAEGLQEEELPEEEEEEEDTALVRGADGRAHTAFFVPQWSNMEGFDGRGKRLYMDADGNSLKTQSIDEQLRLRRSIAEGRGSKQLLDRFVAERPMTPREAMLEIGSNIFPRRMLQNQLEKIRITPQLRHLKHVVDLEWNGRDLLVREKPEGGDIVSYPLRGGDKPEGSIVIWEFPPEGQKPQWGDYIAGCDPYDQDDSTTNSLGSVIIFKMFNGTTPGDCIVAEYSGRPSTADTFYENARKLVHFYNAPLLFENNCKGLYPYFVQKGSEGMLVDQPDDVIGEIIRSSRVNRRKGIFMTKQIRQYGEREIKGWLEGVSSDGRPNIDRILSEPLIEELLYDDQKRNVDRVIALCMVMINRRQRMMAQDTVGRANAREQMFFSRPLFSYDDDLGEGSSVDSSSSSGPISSQDFLFLFDNFRTRKY